MSKELTEQWRNGKLEQKYYYVKYFWNGKKPFVEIELKNFLLDLVKVKDSDKIEVLASVPSYDEYNKLVQKMHILEKQLEIATKALEALETKSDNFDDRRGIQEQLDFLKDSVLIAEYPTWQEAVNSKEFNGGK